MLLLLRTNPPSRCRSLVAIRLDKEALLSTSVASQGWESGEVLLEKLCASRILDVTQRMPFGLNPKDLTRKSEDPYSNPKPYSSFHFLFHYPYRTPIVTPKPQTSRSPNAMPTPAWQVPSNGEMLTENMLNIWGGVAGLAVPLQEICGCIFYRA